MKDRIRYSMAFKPKVMEELWDNIRGGNSILKNEYFLDAIFKTKEEAREAIKTAIWTYNHRKLHEKLNYRTPSEFRKSFEGAA